MRTAHGTKLVDWLKGDSSRRLEVLAYDDRNIKLNGKLVLSPSGGTYRATHRMAESLGKAMTIEQSERGPFIRFTAPQVEMLVHRNPENKILHTVLVGEMNGYIHALTAGTAWEGKLASLDGPRAYAAWIERDPQPAVSRPQPAIPPRRADAVTAVRPLLPRCAIWAAKRAKPRSCGSCAGNVPDFLRHLVSVSVKAKWDGKEHTAIYDVMPDYLAIGSDADFVRMPMTPRTAQAFCDAAGMALPTRKMCNDIWAQAAVRSTPSR